MGQYAGLVFWLSQFDSLHLSSTWGLHKVKWQLFCCITFFQTKTNSAYLSNNCYHINLQNPIFSVTTVSLTLNSIGVVIIIWSCAKISHLLQKVLWHPDIYRNHSTVLHYKPHTDQVPCQFSCQPNKLLLLSVLPPCLSLYRAEWSDSHQQYEHPPVKTAAIR